MFKKLARFTVIGATVALISACGNYQGAGDNMQSNGLRTYSSDHRVDRLGTDRDGLHNNRNLRVNREVARAIEGIDGVSRAHVVVGETNAYVAVELEDHQGRTGGNVTGQNVRGTRGTGSGMTGSLSTRGTTTGTGRMGGLSSSITDHGAGRNGTGLLGGLFDGGRTAPGTGGTAAPGTGLGTTGTTGGLGGLFGTPGPAGTFGGGTAGQYGMYGGQSGRVGMNDTGMMGRRWNAAGTTDNDLAPTMRTMIDRTVRNVVPDIRNVYISTDPAFVQQMSTYTDRLGDQTRRGMRGLVNGFNQFVRTIFIAPFTDNDNDNYRNRSAVNNTMDNSFTRTNPRNTVP